MKTTLSKLAKILMAAVAVVMLISAFPLSAFADPPTNTLSETGKADGGNVVNIPKGVTLIYAAGVSLTLYPPDIEYNFTIEPVTPADGSTVGAIAVAAGPANSASVTGQPIFSSSESEVRSPGETVRYITVTIDPTKFSRPGVYRYKLTDATTTSDLYTAGISRHGANGADYLTTRYLDVYVNAKSDDSGYEVSGYVLHNSNAASYSETGKSSGYIEGDGNGYDSYRNYATMLKKVVTGAMGDKTHSFTFDISLNNNGKPYYYAVYPIDDNSERGPRLADNDSRWQYVAAGDTGLTQVSLKHNDALVIRGLNPHATFNYTEHNNTLETYMVKANYIKDNTTENEPDETFFDFTGVASGGTVSLSATPVHVCNYETANNSSSVTGTVADESRRFCKFTNKLDAVSPTGIILRFIPFIILAAFAGLLFMLAGKTKDKNKDTRKI
ncbi:MAG: hypothetical protein IKS17_10000 [Firmicutes bacterium]|nr:hypothetical protein [Bacillota bacterium]